MYMRITQNILADIIYIYIYIWGDNQYHELGLITQSSFDSLSPSPSLLFFTPVRSSRLHSVSAQSWCTWVSAGQQNLVCPCVGVQRRTLVMSSSYFFSKKLHVWFVLLRCFFYQMEGSCSVQYYRQDLFQKASGIYIPRQQYLLYWKWWQHTHRKDVAFYWQDVNRMEIWSLS